MRAPASWTAEVWEAFLTHLQDEDVEVNDLKGYPPEDVESIVVHFLQQHGITPLRAAKMKKHLRDYMNMTVALTPGQSVAPGPKPRTGPLVSSNDLAAKPLEDLNTDAGALLEPSIPCLTRMSLPGGKSARLSHTSAMAASTGKASPPAKSPAVLPGRQRLRPAESLAAESPCLGLASVASTLAGSPPKRPRADCTAAAMPPVPSQQQVCTQPASLANKPMADFSTPIGRKNIYVLGYLYKKPVTGSFGSKNGKKEWAKFSLYLEDATGTRGEVQLKNCRPSILPPLEWLGQLVIVGPLEVRRADERYHCQGKCFDAWTKPKVYLAPLQCSKSMLQCVRLMFCRYLASDVPVDMPPRPAPELATCELLQTCNVGTSVSVHGFLRHLDGSVSDDGERLKGILLVADLSGPTLQYHLVPVTFWHENVELVTPEHIGQGLFLGGATVRIYRGTTRLEAESLTEVSFGDEPSWENCGHDDMVEYMHGSNAYAPSAMDPLLSVAAVLRRMPEKAFFLHASVASVDVREFYGCPSCSCRADLLEEDGTEYVCTSCGDTFEDARFAEFAVVQLMDATGADVLDASAWDVMCDLIQPLEGQEVIFKVTPRTDNPEAVSIDHIQLQH